MLRNRKQIRLRNFDYASEGWYFVTICTKNRESYFGDINNQQMVLTGIGEIAHQLWTEIPAHFPMVELGEFVVMPNHIHGIIGIHHKQIDDVVVGPPHGVAVPGNQNQFGRTIPGSLSAIIGQYKSSVSRWCNKNKQYSFGWQSRFHDHVIRNQEEFDRIEKYILENIENWGKDKFFS